MKTPSIFMLGTILVTGISLAQPLPEPLPAARFEKLVAQWPFAVATVVAPPPVEVEGWATNLFVVSIATPMKDGKEVPVVTIKSRAEAQEFYTLHGPDVVDEKSGLSLVNVEHSDRLRDIRVMVRKGGEVQPIRFDQAAVEQSASAPPVPEVPRPPRPANAGRPNGVPRPTAVRPPQPGARGVNPPAPGENRRRIRVINSKPPGQPGQ